MSEVDANRQRARLAFGEAKARARRALFLRREGHHDAARWYAYGARSALQTALWWRERANGGTR